eukprot:scpid44061/ scgid18157/ 
MVQPGAGTRQRDDALAGCFKYTLQTLWTTLTTATRTVVQHRHQLLDSTSPYQLLDSRPPYQLSENTLQIEHTRRVEDVNLLFVLQLENIDHHHHLFDWEQRMRQIP